MKFINLTILLSLIIICTCGFAYQPKKSTYISLAPNITEIIYAIKAEDKLVAVTSWSNFPEEAQKLPKVGDAFFINKEEIIKRKPEYVFALTEHKVFLDDLSKLGIKLVYFSFEKLEDVYKNINITGKYTNKQKEALKLVQDLKNQQKDIKTSNTKRIFFAVHSAPIITVGNKSFINDIIKRAGHKNITENINSSYPSVNIEYVLANKPDLIITTNKESADYLSKFVKTKYKVINYKDMDILLRPGPRIIQSMKMFASF